MAHKVIMPKAGMSMEKGVIVAWLKETGEKVSYGEPLLEIETDKTTMQVEALNEGVLLCKLFEAGAEVPVVTTIGYIGEEGETPPQGEDAGEKPAKTEETAKPAETATPAKPEEAPVSGKVPATPLARRLAREKGIDLCAVKGSGHGGKIFSKDIAAHKTAEAQAPAAAVQPVPQKEDTLIPLSGMRKTIARRMSQSHTEIPPVTLNSEADVTALSKLRGEINARGLKISFNDLILKACAAALGEYPEANASYTDKGILRHGSINIGVAVAVDDGLIVPVIRDADSLSLKALSAKAKELAGKARENALSPDEYTGGTFTVSNLGMFGITSFTPIINLPECCILGVCAITERLKLNAAGAPESRRYMGLSLTFDHRCIDGAGAAKFLKRIVEILENPVEILL